MLLAPLCKCFYIFLLRIKIALGKIYFYVGDGDIMKPYYARKVEDEEPEDEDDEDDEFDTDDEDDDDMDEGDDY